MPLKLNKIKDEIIQKNIEDTKSSLGPRLAAPPQTEDPLRLERYYRQTGNDCSMLGQMLYQQEGREEDIRNSLRQAGTLLLRMHTVRQPPQPGEYRIPWVFEKALNLLICFPDQTDPGTLVHLEQWRYYGSKESPEATQMVRYLGVLKSFLGGAAFDDKTALSIQDQVSLDTATKDERLFLSPKIKALRALARQDAVAFELALKELVQNHEAEAKKGELAKSFEAFICLPALMLARLARDRGMAFNVESPYLPVKLLE